MAKRASKITSPLNRRKTGKSPVRNSEATEFKPGQSGNPKGRPPKLLHQVVAELKAKGYEPVKEVQIVDAYETLLQLPKSEVNKIQKDESKPFFLRLVAQWMDSARGMEMLDRIMDRSFGKVMMRQILDSTVTFSATPIANGPDRETLLKDTLAKLGAIDKEQTE